MAKYCYHLSGTFLAFARTARRGYASPRNRRTTSFREVTQDPTPGIFHVLFDRCLESVKGTNQLSLNIHLISKTIQGGTSRWISGLVRLLLWLSRLLPVSTRADGKLTELAKQVGEMVEHHRSKSAQPNYPDRRTTL